jgi:hypothetical protein
MHSGLLAVSLVLGMVLGCSGTNGTSDPTDPESSPGKPAAAIRPTTGELVASHPTSGPLAAAHRAYLEGDFLAFGERLRDVLLDPATTDLARENALDLLDKAYQVQKGALPSRFTLPAGYSGLQLASRRFVTPHGPRYELRLAGSAVDASHLKNLTLRHLPGETLMDKASGQGKFSIRHDAFARSQGVEEFVIDSGPLDGPPADGVLSIRLELDDGTVSEGFVLAHSLVPPAAPDPVSPAPSEVLSGPNPLVRWASLGPVQPGAYERRRLSLYVNRQGEDTSVWEFATKTPDTLTEVRLGSAAGASEIALTPGAYWLQMSAVESRRFGPVEVLRATRVSRPFSVAR